MEEFGISSVTFFGQLGKHAFCLAVVFLVEEIFGHRTHAVGIREERLQYGTAPEVEVDILEHVVKLMAARVNLVKAIEVLHILAHDDFGCVAVGGNRLLHFLEHLVLLGEIARESFALCLRDAFDGEAERILVGVAEEGRRQDVVYDKVVFLFLFGEYAQHGAVLRVEGIEPVAQVAEEGECFELCEGAHVNVYSLHLHVAEFLNLMRQFGIFFPLFPFRILVISE